MRNQISKILGIAVPLIIAQLAIILNGFSDVYFSSNHSSNTAAVVGISSSIFVTAAATLVALIHGLSSIFSEQWGSGNKRGLSESLKAGLIVAIVSSTLLSISINYFSASLLKVFDVPEELWDPVLDYLGIATYSLPAIAISRLYFVLASAVDKQKTIVYVNLLSLSIKLIVTWILISGRFGFESLGAMACAFSTLAMFLTSSIASFFILSQNHFSDIRGAFFSVKLKRSAITEMLKLGIPMSILQFAEIASLTIISFIVAPLGELSIAAHQILSSLTVLAFTFPYCIGMASQIMIARSIGKAEYTVATKYSRLGITMSGLLALLLCTLMLIFQLDLVAIFSSDANLSSLLIPIFPIFLVYILFDAVQASINSSLRGFRVVVFPTFVYIGFLWGIGVAGGWALCYGTINLSFTNIFSFTLNTSGLSGVWFASAVSLALISIVIFIRLRSAENEAQNHITIDVHELSSRQRQNISLAGIEGNPIK